MPWTIRDTHTVPPSMENTPESSLHTSGSNPQESLSHPRPWILWPNDRKNPESDLFPEWGWWATNRLVMPSNEASLISEIIINLRKASSRTKLNNPPNSSWRHLQKVCKFPIGKPNFLQARNLLFSDSCCGLPLVCIRWSSSTTACTAWTTLCIAYTRVSPSSASNTPSIKTTSLKKQLCFHQSSLSTITTGFESLL